MKDYQVMSLDKISQKYPDQWIAVKVLDRDVNGQPVKVRLLEKNQDLFDIRRRIIVEDVCIFFTGSIPQTGIVLML